MKELVFRSEKNTPVTTSLLVSEKFEKNHRDVLEAIDELVKGVAEKSADLFHETTYVHHQNKLPCMPNANLKDKPKTYDVIAEEMKVLRKTNQPYIL